MSDLKELYKNYMPEADKIRMMDGSVRTADGTIVEIATEKGKKQWENAIPKASKWLKQDGTIVESVGGGGGGGTTDHNALTNRNIANQHNIESITNLQTTLDNKVNKDGTKVLSDINFTQVDKNKLDGLSNYDDTQIKNDIDLKADLDLGNVENSVLYTKGIEAGLGQNIPEIQPIIELYITGGNASLITLSNDKPTGLITIPVVITTTGTTINLRYTYTEDGIISALSRFKMVLYLDSIETNRIYQFSSTVIANIGGQNYLVGGDLYSNQFAVVNPRIELPLENNVLPTNLNRKAGDYFEVSIRITKSNGSPDSVNILSSPLLDSKLVRNGGDIGTVNVVDFNGTDTKTQSQRNREYENSIQTINDKIGIIGTTLNNIVYGGI